MNLYIYSIPGRMDGYNDGNGVYICVCVDSPNLQHVNL